MANPWSHEYENEKRDLRQRLKDDEGLTGEEANARAKEAIEDRGDATDPTQAPTDRARGPKGER